jgi:photosystem II stability/assembly factor-like uncharacterized protein
MRRRLLPLVALPVLAAVLAAPVAPGPAAPVAVAAPAPAPVTASALEALLDPRTEPGDPMLAARGGTVPAGAFERASAQAARVGAATRATDPKVAGAKWALRGPTNIGGRLLDVVVDPRRKDSVFVASASGGVWHSTDAGMRFRSVWPDHLTQAIGALDISRTGVLWAGTGEAGPGGGSITYGGTGVYRSADGGRTWKDMGLKGSDRIGRVVVDPRDEDVVWVAANGPLYTRGGERGLYKTTNGGKSWSLVLKGLNETTGAVDVQLDPKDSSTVYATTWDRIREPDRRLYTGPGSGAFKSTDGGRTWARIGGPSLASSPTLGRLGIAVAPSDPNRVYITASTEAGLTQGLYRSDNAGVTFTPGVDVPLVTGGLVYAWWFGRVYVDPKDPDHVFVTGVNMSESKDGGLRFRSSPGLHADQHGMAWDPKVPGRVYVANDGGSYTSDDNGASFENGEYMPWTQPYSVAVSQQDPRRILVGLQDNGSNRNYRADEDPAADQYTEIVGGDGTEVAIDPDDHSIVYGCSQYGGCRRSTNGGESMSGFDHEVVGTRKNWLTPIEFDPANPDTVYTASEIVSKSTDRGETWRPISPDLTGGPGRETNPLFRNYGTVTTLAVADTEHGTIYAGTDDGNIAYTHDGGTTWTQATGLPGDWVTAVTIDHRDPAKVAYASFSGLRAGKQKSLVYRTADGGRTWTDISGNLPQAPVNDVLVVGADLVAASDVGVFLAREVSTGLGRTWLKVGSGLPNAPITSLDWQAKTRTLLVSNFGRGAYSVALPDLGRPAAVRRTGAARGGGKAAVAAVAAAAGTPAARAAVPTEVPDAVAAPAAPSDVRAVPVAQSEPLRLPAAAAGALGLLCAAALLGLAALRPGRRRS